MKIISRIIVCTILVVCFQSWGGAAEIISQQDDLWHGYTRTHYKIAGRAAYVVAPKNNAEGKPWIWRARFPDFHYAMDVSLLSKGWHIAYVDVANLFGGPEAIKIGDAFYHYLTSELGFSNKPVLEGVSRGGLFVYNWAAQNLDKVACIYCDTPVCDFKSWPGGKGRSKGSDDAWQKCLNVYGLTETQALAYDQNPIDHAATLAEAEIPILHIVSENDQIVPPEENTYLLKSRLEQYGHALHLISVAEGTETSQGHHFTHPDPNRVVGFMLKHAGKDDWSPLEILQQARRIVFLGDSITYKGDYVTFFEVWLLTQQLDPVVINVGLPSETVSGLSEEGHAQGKFPRPYVKDRLARVLDLTQPDLVVACYGMNCGIYQPFDDGRFQAYQAGIRYVKEEVEKRGGAMILVTPPFYDDLRAKNQFSYNAVLDYYATWLVAQRKNDWHVFDLHHAMTEEVLARRLSDPSFTFQQDAVHPDRAGHWFMAQHVITCFGDQRVRGYLEPGDMLKAHSSPETLLARIRQRSQVRRDAYLSAAGHKRPGIKAGLPIEDAKRKDEQLTTEIQALIGKN